MPHLEFCRKLGEICGEWLVYLENVRKLSDLHITYESLCDRPDRVFESLREKFVLLEDIDESAEFQVKDYEPAALRNMNVEQRAKLSAAELNAIAEGLSPFEKIVTRLGYSLDI